eukprot:jgi/Orpsp1_1/1178885/evm.model.c7180000067096.1
MQFKTLWKGILFFYFSSLSLARYYDDCDEIYGEITNSKNTIVDCEINDNDEVTLLGISNSLNGKLTKDDFKKIFSYNTIDTFIYMEEKSNCNLLSGISKLNNLNGVTIQSYKGYIEDNILSELVNVKKLRLFSGYISEKNIEAIASLPNLEELSFFKPEFMRNITFKSFENNKKITSVTLQENDFNTIKTYDLIKSLKNIKSLTIKNMVLTQEQFDDITTLSNLEELHLSFLNGKKEFLVKSFDSVKNLTNLTL